MHEVGVMILTCPLRCCIDHLTGYLTAARSVVRDRLYIKFEPELTKLWPLQTRNGCNISLLSKVIPTIYFKANECCSTIDVRVLQAMSKSPNIRDHYLNRDVDVILTDFQEEENDVIMYMEEQFNKTCKNVIKLKRPAYCSSLKESLRSENQDFITYRTSVVGGTFDRLHSGHKVLLSEAILRTTQKLFIGVTDGNMLKHKVLAELIEPVGQRIKKLKTFLTEVDPTIKYDVVPIYDHFGPSVAVSDIDCIIVSEETKLGGCKVNNERIKRGLKKLEIHCVPIVEHTHNNVFHDLGDVKVSSTLLRMDLLGSYMKLPEHKPHLPRRPYLIGFSSGNFTGRHLFVNSLQSLGVPTIDGEELIIRSCPVGDPEYIKIVEEYGLNVTNVQGSLNLLSLEKATLLNPQKREWLTALLLPKIEEIVYNKIQEFVNQGYEIIVWKLPNLLLHDWNSKVHQIWATILPEEKALHEIKVKYRVDDSQSRKIFGAFGSVEEIIDEANIVFTNQWSGDIIMKQAKVAWDNLQDYLKRLTQEENTEYDVHR